MHEPHVLFLMGATLLALSPLLQRLRGERANTYALLSLAVGALMLNLAMAFMDPFLNQWDEQYHALVAKNLLHDPIRPTLIANPILPYDFRDWTANHVWLHKPPLFLWQMAAAMALFGETEWALRIPSALLSTATALLVYSMGVRLFNPRAGILAAVFYASNQYILELVSGRMVVDHNDVAFVFYVTASLWAYVNYQATGQRNWAVVIGLASGLAMMNKWLPGLLVFGGWAVVLLVGERRRDLGSYVPFVLALLVAAIVFLPWQLYIATVFPEEAAHEAASLAAHFFEVIEGHDGDRWYHLEKLGWIYSQFTPWLLPVGLGLMIWTGRKARAAWGLVICLGLLYGFFSAAATKMPNFVLPGVATIALAMGTTLDHGIRFLTRWTRFAEIVVLGVAGVLFYTNMKPALILERHDPRDRWHRRKAHNAEIFRSELNASVGRGPIVIFGPPYELGDRLYGWEIEAMFYTGIPTYPQMPSEQDLKTVRRAGFEPVLLLHGGADSLGSDGTEIITLPIELRQLRGDPYHFW